MSLTAERRGHLKSKTGVLVAHKKDSKTDFTKKVKFLCETSTEIRKHSRSHQMPVLVGGSSSLNRSPVLARQGVGQVSLYCKVQGIMGNDHMGLPPVLTVASRLIIIMGHRPDRQTQLKLLPSSNFAGGR